MNSRFEQFAQIVKGPVWDGNLISKHDRDELVKVGLIARREGWNFTTDRGIQAAIEFNLLKA